MKGKLQRIWKESAIAQSRYTYYSKIFVEGMRKKRKTSALTTDDPAQIRTRHLMNTSTERYPYTKLPVVTVWF
jgi:hypothetical protein